MIAFTFAAFALLAAPGPSNALMALAGAERGRKMLRLLPILVIAYLVVIIPLTWIEPYLSEHFPLFDVFLKGVAALWVMVLAVKLWRAAQRPKGQNMTPLSLVLTTLLNPKSLVLGLALLPAPQDPLYLAHIAILVLIIALIGAAWGLAGSLLPKFKRGPALLQGFTRLAAIWLGAVSLGLASSLWG